MASDQPTTPCPDGQCAKGDPCPTGYCDATVDAVFASLQKTTDEILATLSDAERAALDYPGTASADDPTRQRLVERGLMLPRAAGGWRRSIAGNQVWLFMRAAGKAGPGHTADSARYVPVGFLK